MKRILLSLATLAVVAFANGDVLHSEKETRLCISNQECGTGQVCNIVTGECMLDHIMLKSAQCRFDEDCVERSKEGETRACKNGYCVIIHTPDDSTSETLKQAQQVEGDPECLSHVDCEAGYSCVNGSCLFNIVDGAPCKENVHCKSNELCIRNSCMDPNGHGNSPNRNNAFLNQ